MNGFCEHAPHMEFFLVHDAELFGRKIRIEYTFREFNLPFDSLTKCEIRPFRLRGDINQTWNALV
jgi:hypothetical protein